MLEKNKKLPAYYAVVGIILIALFISPWFWFPRHAFDAAGDDHKLHFFVPENYISNFSLYVWNSYSSLSNEYAPYYGFPFIFLPFALKKIGLLPGDIEKFFYGLILVLGFTGTFLFIRELLSTANMDEEKKIIGGAVGALVYTFSPLIMVIEWQPRMSEIFAIFVYPFLLYLFVRSVNQKNKTYLFLGALLSLFFSFTIHMAVPWFVAFFVGAVPFLMGFFLITQDKKLFVKHLLIYLCLASVLNLIWIVIMVDMTFLNPTMAAAVGETFEKKMLPEFLHNVYFMDIFSTLLMLPAKTFYTMTGSIFQKVVSYDYFFIFLTVPLVLAWGFMRARGKERSILLMAATPLLFLFFLITVNVTDLGPKFFMLLLEKVPGFIMFKNFHSKFSLSFSFFYAVSLGISAAVVVSGRSWAIARRALIVLLIVPFALVGRSLLAGDLACVSPSVAIYEKLCPEISGGHLEAVRALKKDPRDFRVFLFPPARAYYMVFRSRNGCYYVAMPYIKPFTGRDEFGGVGSFQNPLYPELEGVVMDLEDNYDFANLYKILSMMNVKYLYAYRDVAPENAQMFLYKYGVIDEIKSALFQTVSHKVGDYGEVSLYKLPYVPPGQVVAGSRVVQVDEREWVSKLVYTDYLRPSNIPMVMARE